LAGGSSIAPAPQPPDQAPNPKREQLTGFDAWRKAGIDTMLIVPRASTHLEYTDIPYALPASRYGQDFTSYYVQAWLNRYLKHEGLPALKAKAKKKHQSKKKHHAKRKRRKAHKSQAAAPNPLFATTIKYLEPQAGGKWVPITLDRQKQLSFYYCSGWSIGKDVNLDPAGVGGCSK
jgi:hypothetical protein